MSKICNDCKEELPVSHFHLRKNGQVNSAYCKPCSRVRARSYYYRMKEEKPEQHQKKLEQGSKWKKDHRDTYGRKADLKKNYGITVEQYDELLDEQQGSCAVCQLECKTGKRLAVDHNHETGEIRGLLCSKCNMGLGMFQDSVKLLAKAGAYLERR